MNNQNYSTAEEISRRPYKNPSDIMKEHPGSYSQIEPCYGGVCYRILDADHNTLFKAYLLFADSEEQRQQFTRLYAS